MIWPIRRLCRREAPDLMRVPDGLINSVAFIGEVVNTDGSQEDIDFFGTGFFVVHRWYEHPYTFLITAKHVAKETERPDRTIRFIANKKGGGTMNVIMASDRWYFHPSDPTADVAILPCGIDTALDVVTIGTDIFVTPERRAELKIGIGDEIVFPGLFTYAPGVRRNMPLTRRGSIAMIPDEPIQVDEGFAEVYLAEARSISGMSGSPVFVLASVGVPGKFFGEVTEEMLVAHKSKLHFLGLMHGHWDVKESELNRPNFRPVPKGTGVNSGISVIVPAHKIIETIIQPGILQLIEEHHAKTQETLFPPKASEDAG
jgi:hypothetical protein